MASRLWNVGRYKILYGSLLLQESLLHTLTDFESSPSCLMTSLVFSWMDATSGHLITLFEEKEGSTLCGDDPVF